MKTETLISQFFIAGIVFHDLAAVQKRVRNHTKLSLVKEPENLHDANAIAVVLPGKKPLTIGYVPRDQTHALHRFRGKISRAIVHAYAPTNATHRMVLVSVYGTAQSQAKVNTLC